MAITYSRNDKILRRKFYQYLVPSVLMILAMSFGSLADSIVIGNILGDAALSASSLSLPIVFLCELPGFAIAAGAGIVGANHIGKRNTEKASKTFQIALILSFGLSLIFIPIGIFASQSIASWLSGNFADLAPMMEQYIKVYLCQAPILGLGLTVAYFLPSDNSPTLGAAYFVIANIVHIGSEILFCLFLPRENAMLGVAGSMGIGMIAGLFVLIPYAFSKRRTITFKTKPSGIFSYGKDMFRAGSSTAALTGLTFVFCLTLNLAATAYLSDGEMPLFAMLSNFSFVVDLCLLGVLQVMTSVIPILYGEKDFFGIRSIVKRVFLVALGVMAVLIAVSLIFPELFFLLFGMNSSQMQSNYPPLMVVRIYVISFLLYAANKFLVAYYPTIMINVPPVASNAFRIGLVGPLSVYFLMRAFGVIGYAYGAIVMEVAALILIFAIVLIGKKLHRYSGKGLWLLPANEQKNVLDFSIPAKEEEISSAVEAIQGQVLSLCKEEKTAALVALSCEEIIANTIAYGYRAHGQLRFIDVTITSQEESFLIRIRDDGASFDPTIYQENETEMRYGGIEVVRKIAKEFRYLRALNTNNTIMEISRKH